MSAVLGTGLGFALLASLALNASYLLQHAGSRDGPAIAVRRPLRTLRSLLASRLWLAGFGAGIAGSALHFCALARAPLSLVQAFAAGGLALAAPVSARVFRRPLSHQERAGVALMVLALALLGARALATAPTHVPAGTLVPYLAASAVVAAVATAIRPPTARGVVLGAAGGALYGAADAAAKAATVVAHEHGLVAAFLSPWALAVAGLSAAAFLAFQRGLQLGPALPVIALMTAATNVVAIAGGLVAYGEPLGATPTVVAVHGGAFVLVAVAAWVLAPAQVPSAKAGSWPSAPAQTREIPESGASITPSTSW